MRLLMITRKVDRADHLAGFTYAWVKKMGEQLYRAGGSLDVICLEKGDTTGLDYVTLHSLGKEKGAGRLQRWWQFQLLAWRLIRNVDVVFCHMNPEYTIAVAPYAKIFRKKIISWYTHRAVTLRLRLVVLLANIVVTASAESFRLHTKKLVVTGHGIDTELFKPDVSRQHSWLSESIVVRLVTVGRISPTKDYESMIKAVQILVRGGDTNFHLDIIGAPGLPEHQQYLQELQAMTEAMELQRYITFVGPIANQAVPEKLQAADVFINLSNTGSVDKAVLEAMACECLVLTSNTAFAAILPKEFCVPQNNPQALAEALYHFAALSDAERELRRQQLRQIVVRDHNLDQLIKKIIDLGGTLL